MLFGLNYIIIYCCIDQLFFVIRKKNQTNVFTNLTKAKDLKKNIRAKLKNWVKFSDIVMDKTKFLYSEPVNMSSEIGSFFEFSVTLNL